MILSGFALCRWRRSLSLAVDEQPAVQHSVADYQVIVEGPLCDQVQLPRLIGSLISFFAAYRSGFVGDKISTWRNEAGALCESLGEPSHRSQGHDVESLRDVPVLRPSVDCGEVIEVELLQQAPEEVYLLAGRTPSPVAK